MNVSPPFVSSAIVSALVFATFTWDFDPAGTDNTATLGLGELLIGTVFLVVLGWLAVSRSVSADGIARGASILLVAVAVPMLWQAPNAIRDPGHFPFTANEMAAVAAGKFPLSDFVPQYSTLLSFPIAPALRLFSSTPEAVVVVWLIALQVFCVAVPLVVVRKAAGWTLVPIGIGLVGIPILALAGGSSHSASTYFAGMPLRYVGPMSLLLVLIGRLSKLNVRCGPVWASCRSRFRDLWLGVACGLVLINNPDFGGPAVGACFVVMLVSQLSWRGARDVAFLMSVGLICSFAGYSILGFVIGKPVDWGYWLLFQRVFGSAGYFAMPMPSFGEHLGYVMTFLAGAALGLSGVLQARRRNGHVSVAIVAAALLYVSLWSLGSLAYFSSRSYSSTLWGGHIFQLGTTVFLAFSFVLCFLRSDPERHPKVLFESGPSIAVVAVSMLFIGGLVTRLPSIQTTSAALYASSSVYPELAEVSQQMIADTNQPEVGAAQILPMSNLVELRTGVRSLALFNHPSNVSASDAFMEQQCRLLMKSLPSYLYYQRESRSLDSHVACGQELRDVESVDPYELKNNIDVDAEASVASDDEFLRFLKSGWHAAETIYVWSAEKEAELFLDLPRTPESEIDLQLVMRSARTLESPLLVDIVVGSNVRETVRVSERKVHRVILRPEDFDATELTVTLRVKNPYVPCLESASPDCRSLGVALETLRLVARR